MRGANQSRTEREDNQSDRTAICCPERNCKSVCSGLTLLFVETKYGHLMINPIGDNVFIPKDEFWNKIEQGIEDLMILGEAFIEV